MQKKEAKNLMYELESNLHQLLDVSDILNDGEIIAMYISKSHIGAWIATDDGGHVSAIKWNDTEYKKYGTFEVEG